VKSASKLVITHVQYCLADHVSTNAELQQEFPEWDMGRVEAKSGILERHVAAGGETALDLAKRACRDLLLRASIEPHDVDGIVFCTQSPDHIMPSDAFLLHEFLELRHDTIAFDYNLACSGYIYGLAIVQGLIEIGLVRNVLLVTADTYSKYINKADRATRSLFSDAAAVSLISEARGGSSGVMDISLASSGKNHRSFYIPAGGCRLPRSDDTARESADEGGNVRSMNDIHMDGFAVWKFIATEVPKQIASVLARNNLTVDDIDLYVFHQASKLTLDSLTKALQIPCHKVYTNMASVGNCVSASIPIALADAAIEGRLRRGQLVLLSGFGVGLSWGTLLMRY